MLGLEVGMWWAIACSDYGFKAESDVGTDSGDTGALSTDTKLPTDVTCDPFEGEPFDVNITDDCGDTVGTFTPTVEWEVNDAGGSMSLPVVADLDGDGVPEILVNLCTSGFSDCRLNAWHGDGSGLYAQADIELGYGAGPAVGDIDHDGTPEVIIVEGSGAAVVALDHHLEEEWSSGSLGSALDYATYPSISDMDHDGSPEIIAGNAILYADGTTRALGIGPNRGSWYGLEGTMSVVADIDLDGVEEVIAGPTVMNIDGVIVADADLGVDGLPAVGNLDDDPEAEIVLTSGSLLAVLDTDMSVIWTTTLSGANIAGCAAIADLDDDGAAEFVVAAGAALTAYEADGTILWTVPTQDSSGATGPALFDFEGDGILDVVYADQVDVFAVDGRTGAIKWLSEIHDSPTMYDTPVIADVDADGHAEVVVTHYGYYEVNGFSVYGDLDNSWMGTRKVWNQHQYSITNINDDLSIPVTATPNWTEHNNFHTALPTTAAGDDVAGTIMDVCMDDCDAGWLFVEGVLENKGADNVPSGTPLALYADGTLLETTELVADVPPGKTSAPITFEVNVGAFGKITELALVADDDGTGTGFIEECLETNNIGRWTDLDCG